jgi:hydrogenase expression/formation protein HypE
MNIWFQDEEIIMAHGAGGKASRKLIEGLIAPMLEAHGSPGALGDAFQLEGRDILVTTDSFVVNPTIFPGGSLGELAVNGTLNDLAVSGARPVALTLALIIEAGTSTKELSQQLEAIAQASQASGVPVVAGDTKVVEHGKADHVFATTTGVGTLHPAAALSPNRVNKGDIILSSGTLGDHGVTILMARGELDFSSESLRSDTANLWPLISLILDEFGSGIKWMRDPTRGGLASTLNELASDAKIQVELDESALPVSNPVRGACEILGLDPLQIANEGKFIAVADEKIAPALLELMRSHPLGEHAAMIGQVTDEHTDIPLVTCRTEFGAHRTLDMLTGDPLPRIC